MKKTRTPRNRTRQPGNTFGRQLSDTPPQKKRWARGLANAKMNDQTIIFASCSLPAALTSLNRLVNEMLRF